MTGLLRRAPAEDHRALRTHHLTGLHPTHPSTEGDVFIAMEPSATGHDPVRAPGARAYATRAANLADAVPVSQVTWTSAQHIAADVPERHRHA